MGRQKKQDGEGKGRNAEDSNTRKHGAHPNGIEVHCYSRLPQGDRQPVPVRP